MDEILQLSVVRGDGEVLFSDYVKPEVKKRWPKAQEVNGITPAMVKDKRTMCELFADILPIFQGARLAVGYNLDFDLAFLDCTGISISADCLESDVMKEYAPLGGQLWPGGKWKWGKLEQCASHYGYKFEAHDALEDVLATLHCFWAMLGDSEKKGYLELVNVYSRIGAKGWARRSFPNGCDGQGG